jgi:hypothetical protein
VLIAGVRRGFRRAWLIGMGVVGGMLGYGIHMLLR